MKHLVYFCRMGFAESDIVSFLNDTGTGIVIRIEGPKVLVENEFGFEDWFDESELVPHRELPVGEIQRKDELKPRKRNVEFRPNELIKDLHFAALVDFPKNFTRYEMVQIQLKETRKAIDKARSAGIKKVILIHGVGEGRLKEEIHTMLERMEKLTFYDASYHKYGQGATEVELF